MRLLYRRPDFLTAVVVALLVWPLLHMSVVRCLDISSWRLGGWGMYATPAPKPSDVVVVVRSCEGGQVPLPQRGIDPHMVWLGEGTARFGSLAGLNPEGRRLARDLSAFRQDRHFAAFDRWLRRTHGLGPSVPVAIAVLQPRIDLKRERLIGDAQVRVLGDGQTQAPQRVLSSVNALRDVLPACRSTP